MLNVPRGNKLDKTYRLFLRADVHLVVLSALSGQFMGVLARFFCERIIREIQEAIGRFGITQVEFEDDNLTLNKKRAIEILKASTN